MRAAWSFFVNEPLRDIALFPSEPARILPPRKGQTTLALAVSGKGEVLRLLVDANIAPALFAGTQSAGEYSAILEISDSYGSQELQLTALNASFPQVQVSPNGEILIVAARCRRFTDGSHELNARVYDTAGNLCREFLLGDGIEHVQIDKNGKIWVGYFDEGVFGNYGWGHGNDHFGAAGLSCFDSEGRKLWDFQPPSGTDFIADCYALNVSKDGVWAYYYTGFPFVRVDDNWDVKAWNSETSGAREFAVHGKQLLLYGGYGQEKTNCKLLRLENGAAKLAGRVCLTLPPDEDLSVATVIGRDNVLHVLAGVNWYLFRPAV